MQSARSRTVLVAIGALALLASMALPAAASAPGVPAALDVLGPGSSLLCGGLDVLDVEHADALCTHGPDSAPARGTEGNRPGVAMPRRAVTCIDDGTTGQRVEVLYLHGPAAPAASSSRRTEITRWVEQVEWTVHESARRLGGRRGVRWSTSSCGVRVTSQRVGNGSLQDFDSMVEELRSLGYSRSDRTYLVFVDSDRYCGIATAPRDDRATGNRADSTVGYARVDRGCWDVADRGFRSIAAHELFHTLGAVQASAPHGTAGAHCSDEHDLLCYDDGSGRGVQVVCRDDDNGTSGAGDQNDQLLDCRGDDYFNPSPRRGSYLDRHWNTADSARLHEPVDTGARSACPAAAGGSATPTARSTRPTSSGSPPPGSPAGATHPATTGSVPEPGCAATRWRPSSPVRWA